MRVDRESGQYLSAQQGLDVFGVLLHPSEQLCEGRVESADHVVVVPGLRSDRPIHEECQIAKSLGTDN